MTDNADPPLPSRLIRLVQAAPALAVHPVQDAAPGAFQPFWLPEFHLSSSCWLSALAARFRQKHGRCIALLMMLDCQSRRWSDHLVPTQRCTANGTAWSFCESDFESVPPSRFVGGTFQTMVGAGLDEVQSVVPPIDGLHTVMNLGKRPCENYLFLRAQGVLNLVPPGHVIYDDWEGAIASHHDRLQCHHEH